MICNSRNVFKYMFGITMFRGVETTRLLTTEGRQVTTYVIFPVHKITSALDFSIALQKTDFSNL